MYWLVSCVFGALITAFTVLRAAPAPLLTVPVATETRRPKRLDASSSICK